VKKAEAAQTAVQFAQADQAAAPAAQPAASDQAPGQAAKTDAAASSDTQAGVKPDNTTTGTKPTQCSTGGATGDTATCTAVAPTPATKPDVSKRYGNGETAAQIAVGRGAPAGTLITGPGNSQPHKVTACGKPNNKSGGVDVHAVKSYDASACQPTAIQPTTQTQVTQVCGQKTTVTTSTQVVGVLHGKNEHLMTNPKSAHFTKHDDTKAVSTETETKVEATGETCGTSPQTPPVITVTPAPVVTPVTVAPVTSGAVNTAPATQGSSSTTPSQNASGVLGANATINKPKPASGVLGSVANVAGGTLPFTGFPVWVAVLLALALIAAGLMVWRRGSSTPTRI
jgi:hypothetical protein